MFDNGLLRYSVSGEVDAFTTMHRRLHSGPPMPGSMKGGILCNFAQQKEMTMPSEKIQRILVWFVYEVSIHLGRRNRVA